MCGLAGIVCADARRPVEEERLLRMARALRHRGPDGFGFARDEGAGFVSARLAIFDLPGGWQPIEATPRGNLIVYNGEVYNHPELRGELARDGTSFSTTTDTEVVLRLLERDGLRALDRFNGQFAFAWWQPRERRLVLVRDRFGVRPLHWSQLDDGTLVFASEARALFASGLVTAAPDLQGIDEVFTTWGSRPPRTVFRGVQQLPPGGLLVWEDGRIVEERTWWTPAPWDQPEEKQELGSLMRDSVSLRLRADVPVGAYLSGGLDSSLISALAQETTGGQLRTFSVAFTNELYDERGYQEEVAAALGTSHHVVEAGSGEIAGAFPDVVLHAETPMVRTAPVPLYLLAREVREQGITVVATGEGADELFWGYDLFKEVALRRLHAQDPARAEELLNRLYPYLGGGAGRRGPAWQQFILQTGAGDDPLASHLTRVEATATVKAFYSPDVAAELPPPIRWSGCAPTCPPASASSVISNARRGSRSRPCWSPTCWPPRATAWRWPTASKVATRSSTTGFLPRPSACRPRTSSTASTTRLRSAASPTRCCRPRSPAGPSSRTARPRSSPSSPRGRPSGSITCSLRRRSSASGCGTPRGWRACCGAAAPAGLRASARAWRSWGSSRPSCGTSRSAASSKQALNPKTWNRE